MSSGFKRPVAPQGTLLKGGWLWKRQGDSHIKGQDYSGLKFKKRFIRLDKEFLYYYRGPSVSLCNDGTRHMQSILGASLIEVAAHALCWHSSGQKVNGNMQRVGIM